MSAVPAANEGVPAAAPAPQPQFNISNNAQMNNTNNIVVNVAGGGGGPKELKPWSTGLCGCLEDPIVCIITCCVPCIQHGLNAQKLGGGCFGACCSYCILEPCGLCCCVAAPQRGMMRSKYGLFSQPCDDCLVHTCCGPCGICQEARQLKHEGAF